MSTIRAQNRRRRSHSSGPFSSSSSSLPHIARKVSMKRAYPQQFASPLGEACRWNTDDCRRGKRRKRGLSAGSGSLPRILQSSSFNAFPQSSLRPSNSSFAVSSDDFGLPMGKGKKRERTWCTSASNSFMEISDSPNLDNLRRLRSNAFYELERSVEENGEGLIRRMREHEYLRTNDLNGSDRGRSIRTHGSPAPSHPYHSDMSEDDDDEIHIYSGEPSTRSSPHHAPDITMDGTHYQHDNPTPSIHHPFNSTFVQPGCHPSHTDSPYTQFPSSSPLSSSPPATPLPSQSLLGLPHSAPTGATSFGSRPPASDESEKIIEALALALAGGAGGLNDYNALRQPGDDDVNACHAGDLWR